MRRPILTLMACGLVLGLLTPGATASSAPTLFRSGDGVMRADAPDPGTPIRPRPGTVALTFDDGPSAEWTPLVLDVLARYDVKATFFVVGWRVDRHPEIVRRMVAEGHSVQNHSWSHRWLTRESTPVVISQLDRGSRSIIAATGRAPHCFRPPFGAHDARVRSLIAAAGLHSIMWDRDPQEWLGGSARLIDYVVRYTRGGDVVLTHDTSGQVVVDALPVIIEGLRARGLGFDTICEPAHRSAPASEARPST